MSKKQREKVEEEVNFHQSQNRLRGSTGSGTSPDPWNSTVPPDTTSQGETCVFPPSSWPPYPDQGQPSPYTARALPGVADVLKFHFHVLHGIIQSPFIQHEEHGPF